MKSLTINVPAASIVSMDFDNRTINVSDIQPIAANNVNAVVASNYQIGQFVPEYNGLYAGIVTGDTHGQKDAHIYLIQTNSTYNPYTSSDVMEYDAAMKYSNSIGVDGYLPTRSESALLFANCASHIPNGHVWIRSINNRGWCQDFDSGNQYTLPDFWVRLTRRVVLIRRIPIL